MDNAPANATAPYLDPVALTQRLVRAKSVNPPGDTVEVVEVLSSFLKPCGYSLTTVETPGGGRNLLAVLKGSGQRPALCLTGHMDTVPLGATPWSVDPFGGEIRSGRLYGRGASDMKAGVSAMVSAAVAMAEIADRAGDVVLILTAAEETGCLGAKALAASGLLSRPAGALLVAEPTGCRPLLGHKGALWVRAGFTGKAAHGSMPQHGVNAVDMAVRAATLLPQLLADREPHPFLGPPTLSICTFQGGGKVNVVPDKAVVELDIRTVPGMNHDAVLKALQLLWPQAALQVLTDVPPVLTDSDDPFVSSALNVLAALEGARPTPGSVSFFTDASVLAEALDNPPVLLFGPGESEQAHQTDESCPVDAITMARNFYLAMAVVWLQPSAAGQFTAAQH